MLNIILCYIYIYLFKPYMEMSYLIHFKSNMFHEQNIFITLIPTFLLLLYFHLKLLKTSKNK